MTSRRVFFMGLLSAAAILGGVPMTTARAASPQPTAYDARATGAHLFKTYCASCHGTSARGDGPLADVMRRRPSNLTEIAQRNQGTFPSELVSRIIDGRQGVQGHGGPDMPVWGDAFMRTSDAADEASVRARIQALVEYLASIQARNTE